MKFLGEWVQFQTANFRSDVWLDDGLYIDTLSDAGGDTDRFLVWNALNKNIAYRTGAEVLSDIGAGTSSLAFDGSTANGVLTYKDADEMTVESNLTFTGSFLTLTGTMDISPASDAGGSALTIDNDDADQIALDIDASNTTANIIDINAQALTTGSAIFIDSNTLNAGKLIYADVADAATSYAGANVAGLEVAYVRNGVLGSGQTGYAYGNVISLRDIAANNASSSMNMTGSSINVDSASTNGTNINTGINITATDATENYGVIIKAEDSAGADIKMTSSADTGDYCTIATTTHGATTITTVDDDANAATLTFNADGAIDHYNYYGYHQFFKGVNSDDYCRLMVGDDGETTLVTVDAAGAAAHFEVAADGNITLDAAGSIDLEPGNGSVSQYYPVNDGNPTFSIGSAAANRFEIKPVYNSGAQTLDSVDFTSYTQSSTTHDARYRWFVDEVELARMLDTGFFVYKERLQVQGEGASFHAYDPTTSSATEGGALRLSSDDGAAMADNHRLGIITFEGAEDVSNNLTVGAQIEAFAEAAWSASENGGRMVFSTTDADASISEVLRLDSNKLATFAGAVTVTGELTGTLVTASQPNITTLAGLSAFGTAGTPITITSDTVTFESANADDPRIRIQNNYNNSQGARLQMKKDRGAAPSNGDNISEVDFLGENASQSQQQYGKILMKTDVVTAGQESGDMRLQVAAHDGTLTQGLKLIGGDESGEVDVTLGAGTTSVTTVTGKLACQTRTLAVSSAVDGNANGDVVYFGGTTSMTVGKIYHYKSDGTWEIANADAVATADGLLGVALGAASDTNGMLLRGMVTLDHDPGAIGDVLYVQSDNAGTPGNATATAPSASGDCVRIIGYQVSHASNGNIWFNPDNTFVEVA